MDNMKIQGVIFDADGTLIDSMGFWNSTVYDLLEEFGVTPDDDLLKLLIPMSMYEGAVYLKNRFSLPVSPEEFIRRENLIVEKFYSESVKLKNGLQELLDLLAEANIPMAVASATDKHLIEKALAHNNIRSYFKAVISCSDIGEGKSSPKVFHTAREYLGSPISSTAVIEDSPNALATAKKAGYIAVGVYDKAQCRDGFTDICDIWLGDVTDISPIGKLL